MQLLRNVGKYKNRAFTIVELLTVVGIMVLLIAAAIPSFTDFLRNNESITVATRLASSLRLAKAEAIKSGIPVTVCPISGTFNPTAAFSQTTEQWPCQNITTWAAWKVFTDPNMNASEDFSDGWPVLAYVGNIGTVTVTSNIAGPITFDSMGFANIQPATTRAGWNWSSSFSSGEWDWNYNYSSAYGGTYYRVFTISPSGCTGKNARAIEITQNGVISITNVDC